jgi:hypothetical protein
MWVAQWPGWLIEQGSTLVDLTIFSTALANTCALKPLAARHLKPELIQRKGVRLS